MFGLSFGAKKEKSAQDTFLNKNENVNASQSQNTQGNTTGTSNVSNSGSTSQTGTQVENQNTKSSQATTGNQTTSGTTTTLGADIQSTLSDAVKSILGKGVNESSIASLSNMIAGRGDFDHAGYVKGVVDQARNRGEQTLQEQISSAGSGVGGTAGTNSAVALLQQRGRNDLEASIGGVKSQAEIAAAQIENQNLGAASGASANLSQQGAQLVEALKGGTTTTDQSTLTKQLADLLGSQSTGSTSTQDQATKSNQATQTQELVSQIVAALSQQNTATVATENVKGSNTKFGGGFSLGI